MRGLIKVDWGYVTEVDGDRVIEVHLWSLERGMTDWLDLGISHFMTREKLIKELERIKSRGWEILVPYENVYIG